MTSEVQHKDFAKDMAPVSRNRAGEPAIAGFLQSKLALHTMLCGRHGDVASDIATPRNLWSYEAA